MNIIKTNLRAAKWVSGLSVWHLPVMALSSLINNLSPFVNIFMSAQIINEISGNRRIDILIHLVSVTLLVNLIISLISILLSRIDKYTTEKFRLEETKMHLNKFLYSDFEQLENGEIMGAHWHIWQASRVNGFGINAMLRSARMFTENIINIVLAISGISSVIYIIIHNPGEIKGLIFAALLILLVISFFILSFRNSKVLAKLGEEITAEGKKQNIISDFFNGDSVYQAGKDYRIYNMKQIINEYKQKKIDILKKNNKKYWYGKRNTQIPEVLLTYTLNFVIYSFVCINALAGVFGVGSVVMYVGFIQRLISAIKDMAANIAMFRMNFTFLNNYLEFYQVNKTSHRGTLTTKTNLDSKFEIEFSNVSFKYTGTEQYALKNLNMKINSGKRLAVVGMNGSGKTTMIKLLCRLYDPTDGIITLNGIDIREYDYNEYMALHSVIFQDFQLFSFSLGQNISASAGYDSVRAEQAIVKVGFYDRLNSMSKGLETPVYKDFAEDGVEISGGEAQKVALARALYKDAPFIVLDEPTAALDPIAEFEIYSRFDDIVGNKTAIYISHRLSSCRFCDDIAVFHEGELIQRGNHDTLITDKRGKYYELWNAQAQYYNTF